MAAWMFVLSTDQGDIEGRALALPARPSGRALTALALQAHWCWGMPGGNGPKGRDRDGGGFTPQESARANARTVNTR